MKSFNLFQNATKQIKNKSKECIIYEKPSTIDDTNDCINEKKTDDLFKHQSDLSEEDKFRACFIDCSCNCSAKKITQGRIIPTTDLGIFEKIFKNLASSNYNVFCDCYCGDNQQRSFSFNYSTGQQK